MAQNESSKKAPLELVPVSAEDVASHVQRIADNAIPVFRKNAEGKVVPVPGDRLHQYLGVKKDIKFYVEKKRKEELLEKEGYGQRDTTSPLERVRNAGNAFEQIETFQNLSIVEREEVLDRGIENLHALKEEGSALNLDTVIAMVEVIVNTFYANYANLEDNLSSENVKNNLFGVFVKTEWMIKLIIELFKSENFKYEDYAIINSINTGSHTVDNINKGFLWYVAFCLYYNEFIAEGMITKYIRSGFKDKYGRYYKRKMEGADVSVERIISGGLRSIDEENELPFYAIGSLLYDLGKIPFIDYHDGDQDYNDQLTKIHVLVGYNMIRKVNKYPFIVSAMAAFHHEYYGGRGSYNFTKPIVSKLTGSKWDETMAHYFITYNESEFSSGGALSFFPCKVMELIDVYIALSGKKKKSHFETLNMIKKEFIASSLKIDPIIFEIFLLLMERCKLLTAEERNEIDAIIY
jgi:hypothetical protein